MNEIIYSTLKEINLDTEYKLLCNKFDDFDNAFNIKWKEADAIIKDFDPKFRYVAKDRTFLKEINFKEFIVRFFIGFKNGIVDFSYLIWKEGENNNYFQGRLASLTEMIDPNFESMVRYKVPIAASLSDFQEIISRIFSLYKQFENRFKEQEIKI